MAGIIGMAIALGMGIAFGFHIQQVGSCKRLDSPSFQAAYEELCVETKYIGRDSQPNPNHQPKE